jgi:predicted Zn finger-like uncharacterized protein
MIVECDKCGTGYNLDDANVPEDGAWVRCTQCGEVFHVMPPSPEPEPELEPEPARPAEELGLGGDLPDDDQEELGAAYGGDLLNDDDIDDLSLDVDSEEKPKSGCIGRLFKAVFWLIALVIILAILVVGGLFAMSKLGMGTEYIDKVRALNIPYMEMILSKVGAPPAGSGGSGAVPDTGDGAISMEVKDAKGMWRNNEQSGRLFIIQGSVVNKHKSARSEVLVQGKLSDSKDNVVAKATVYAGPRFTPEELTSMPLKDIQARLSSPKGADGSLYVVPPGERLFFMVVIGNLPSDLALYTVEVVGSKPLKASQ